jgi:hypothetical protein
MLLTKATTLITALGYSYRPVISTMNKQRVLMLAIVVLQDSLHAIKNLAICFKI